MVKREISARWMKDSPSDCFYTNFSPYAADWQSFPKETVTARMSRMRTAKQFDPEGEEDGVLALNATRPAL